MRKIFMNQVFSGRTKKEIYRERLDILKDLQERYNEKFELIDQYALIEEDKLKAMLTNPEKTSMNDLDRLAVDIALMGRADLIVFAPDWEMEPECYVTRYVAILYELECVMMGKEEQTNA